MEDLESKLRDKIHALRQEITATLNSIHEEIDDEIKEINKKLSAIEIKNAILIQQLLVLKSLVKEFDELKDQVKENKFKIGMMWLAAGAILAATIQLIINLLKI